MSQKQVWHVFFPLVHLAFHDSLYQLLSPSQTAKMHTKHLPQPDVYRLAVLACTSVVERHLRKRSVGAVPHAYASGLCG